MRCPKCGFVSNQSFNFCPNCGIPNENNGQQYNNGNFNNGNYQNPTNQPNYNNQQNIIQPNYNTKIFGDNGDNDNRQNSNNANHDDNINDELKKALHVTHNKTAIAALIIAFAGLLFPNIIGFIISLCAISTARKGLFNAKVLNGDGKTISMIALALGIYEFAIFAINFIFYR